ncbi:Very-long-chain enoyl-CoA reductase [Schistosoma japonicum]|nr:Very-long-chain enoyl-CoA reductase [Schistosoma japonicum]
MPFLFSESSLPGDKEQKKPQVVRQSIRLEPRGKSINDAKRICEFENADNSGCVNFYLKDIGPQIGWRTVFLVEYTGPLVIYAIIWLLRQPFFKNNAFPPISSDLYLRKVALACWCGHYIKRLLETVFIHRFSHATMPLRNIFINCSYYYGFALFVGYFTNHHLYTPPTFGHTQILIGFFLFMIGEWGNFSCHLALKRLRPAGTTVRQIPYPMSGWFFTPLIFTICGFRQMSVWAINKLKAYRREFGNFPKNRKAIVPFIL